MNSNDQHRDIVVAALKHAAPYIRMFKKKTFVIKAGGELFVDPAATRALVEQVTILHQVGVRVVIVHGAGPQSTALAAERGLQTRMVQGRRVTDAATLEVPDPPRCLNWAHRTRVLIQPSCIIEVLQYKPGLLARFITMQSKVNSTAW